MNQPQHLPQWRYEESIYFITWRLDDHKDSLSPVERNLIATNLEHFNEQKYRLAGYVVMDDHVHVVVFPLKDHDLGSILHSWKSYTSKQINRLRGSSGTRWMKDSHTRIIRNEQELRNCLQYILDNPKKRWPDLQTYRWVKIFDVL